MLAIFIFTSPPLKAIFALSLLSEYLALCSLTVLLKYVRHNTAQKMRHKTRWFIYPLHLIYLIVFIVGLTSGQFGAVCTASSVLPSIFYFKEGCFILFFAFLLGLNQNKFLLDWKDPGQQ